MRGAPDGIGPVLRMEEAHPPLLPASGNPSPGAARLIGWFAGSASSVASRSLRSFIDALIARRRQYSCIIYFRPARNARRPSVASRRSASTRCGGSAGPGPGRAGDAALPCKRSGRRTPDLLDVLYWELMQLDILQIVFALKIARVAQACLAEVDCRDTSIRLAQRVTCRLRRPATGDKGYLWLWRGCSAGQIKWKVARRRSGFL